MWQLLFWYSSHQIIDLSHYKLPDLFILLTGCIKQKRNGANHVRPVLLIADDIKVDLFT